MHNCATRPIGKSVTLGITYCFMKPPVPVLGEYTARKNTLKSCLQASYQTDNV